MLRTVEIRWFYAIEPLGISQLFDGAAAPQCRTDWYAYPCSKHCGIKTREGKLEAKLFVNGLGVYRHGDVLGVIEEWAKWSVDFMPGDVPDDDLLAAADWVAVEKARYLRSYAVTGSTVAEVATRAASGCEWEWTELRVAGQPWWTIGFEATGAPEDLENNLRLTLDAVLPGLPSRALFLREHSYGYPTWLNQLHCGAAAHRDRS